MVGWVLRGNGKPAEALAAFERALPIYQKLVDTHPTVTDFQISLALDLTCIAWFRQQAGRNTDAVALWRQAIAIYERSPLRSGGEFYNLACLHANLSGVAAAAGSGMTAEEGRAEAEQAIRCLRRALVAGYRNLALMREDTDLDPLRSRPDFQLLMMDIEFPDDPFARGD
jgi:serine/threonine-protein kinase